MSAGALLYINPLLAELDPLLHLSGYFFDEALGFDPGREIVQVKWANFEPIPQNQNAHEAALELVRLMLLYPGTPEDPTDIIAHSGGSQCANKAIREIDYLLSLLGYTGTFDWSGYRFWLAGDPESPFVGSCYLYPEACPPVYPGNRPHTANCPTPAQFHGGYGVGFGLPPVVPVEVNIITNQYDGWAMAPVDYMNSEIRRSTGITILGLVLTGKRVWDFSMTCVMKTKPHNHKSYQELDITGGTANGVFTYTDPLRPKVKVWYIRNYPVPSLLGRLKFLVRDLDIKRRPIMDAAFGPFNPGARTGLPVTITPPDYDAVSSSWFS